MLPFLIFCTSILLHTLRLIPGIDSTNPRDVDNLVFLPNRYDYDALVCQNRTIWAGIYNARHPGELEGVKCCKDRFLVEPTWVMTTSSKQEANDKTYFPEFLLCQHNVTVENPDDNFATIMWKVHACQVKSILRKKEKDVDFKAYVQMRTVNYTNKDNVQKLVRQGNKKCPEGDKETAFHKKIAAYFWCFHRNSEEVCQETTPESEKELKMCQNRTERENRKINVTCPKIPFGVSTALHCCQGIATPASWRFRFSNLLRAREPKTRLSNGTYITPTSYTNCMKSSYNLMHNLKANSNINVEVDEDFNDECFDACARSPVKFFDNGTSEPQIVFGFFDKVMKNKVLIDFNTAVKKSLLKMKITQSDRVSSLIYINGTKKGIKVDDAALRKLSLPMQRAQLYCRYYDKMVYIMFKKHFLIRPSLDDPKCPDF